MSPMPLSGWAGVQGGQGGNQGRYVQKAADFQAIQKLNDGPPLSKDGYRQFFSKKQSSAGIFFTALDKKWNKIGITIRGQIDTDFGPSCIAKVMDLSEKDEIQKIAESLEKKTMVFKIKITNMGTPYEPALVVKKTVDVQDSWNGLCNILLDDITVGPIKSNWNVNIVVTREGTDPQDTFEGTFNLKDMEVFLPQVAEEMREEMQAQKEGAPNVQKQLDEAMKNLESITKAVKKLQSPLTVLDPNTFELVPAPQMPVQPSAATLPGVITAEVLKNCDMATLQKLKQLGILQLESKILQLESKQVPIFGDPLSPPAVIDKPSGLPLGKMGGRKVDLT